MIVPPWLNPQNVKGHAKRKLIYCISKTLGGAERDIKIINAADYPRLTELAAALTRPRGYKNSPKVI
ncbi:MAG: hypothetical protein QM715_14660 [Nibricoccus sp.]